MFLQHPSTQGHIRLHYVSDIWAIESPPGARELLLYGAGHPCLRSLAIVEQHPNAALPLFSTKCPDLG